MIEAIQSDSTDASPAVDDILRLIDEIGAQRSTVAGAVAEQSAVAAEMSAHVAASSRADQPVSETPPGRERVTPRPTTQLRRGESGCVGERSPRVRGRGAL